MYLSSTFLLFELLGFATCENLQKPLTGSDNVQEALKKAEIIPTGISNPPNLNPQPPTHSYLVPTNTTTPVIDDFTPLLTLTVNWPNAHASLGNTLNPSDLQSRPNISLITKTPPSISVSNSNFILALTDPDAPSRSNPKWSEICHWIAVNLTLSNSDSDSNLELFDFLEGRGEGDDLMPYKPPGPPPKTGKHRYVFLALKPKNGTSEPLRLERPKERQHWGRGEKGEGVRGWAGDGELEVIGANFVYAQNEEQ
ncbi:MAG: hypothetical protein M1820_010770 [Bogoriella megaspora]|nr:MAG: hypothetical protein M1820_010770 [Bogoriella megaspora]